MNAIGPGWAAGAWRFIPGNQSWVDGAWGGDISGTRRQRQIKSLKRSRRRRR